MLVAETQIAYDARDVSVSEHLVWPRDAAGNLVIVGEPFNLNTLLSELA